MAPVKKTGSEPFHTSSRPVGFDVLSFWQWVNSDLLSNALRGRLAEYLVAQALGTADGVRVEWDAVDARSRSGRQVEVKSAAYVQSWKQERPSTICFDVRPTFGWNAETGENGKERRRQANVYVFALLKEQDRERVDPLDLAQWTFYVLAKSKLDAHHEMAKTISLSVLLKLGPIETDFDHLRDAVEAVPL